MLGAAAMLLGGCVSTADRLPMSCERGGPWSDQVRAHAEDVWLLAQLASNSYRHLPDYQLPDMVERLDDVPNDPGGMAYSTFRLRPPSGPDTLVIAYRGTENLSAGDIVDDWAWGNMLGQQNGNAVRAFDDVRGVPAPGGPEPAAPVIVTGHSLGGALATHVSLRRDDVTAHVFNTSPRFWRVPFRTDPNPVGRTSTVESGEFLKLFRVPFAEPNQLYTSIDCTTGKNAVVQHSIQRLARCLTAIAAQPDRVSGAAHADPVAAWSMRANGIRVDFSSLPPCRPSTPPSTPLSTP